MSFDDVASLWRWVDRRAHWGELVADAAISDGLDLSAAPASRQGCVDAFERDGYAIAQALTPEETAAAARCVTALHQAGLPTVFAYVYDALWTPLRSIVAHVATRIGPCDVLNDGWAWYIEPGGGRGWAGHRGWSELARGDDGRPTLVNVWLALSDVDERCAPITVVPRSRDPHYPTALHRVPDTSLGLRLPASAGQIIYWDANVYHWGAASHADAPGPRVSASYSLVARDADVPGDRLGPTAPDFEARLDAIADWLTIYAEQAGGLDPLFLTWARTWLGARQAVRR